MLKISNYLAHSSLRSQKRGMWFVFGQSPKNEPLLLPRASEASA
ncbi:MAG: hypothetical protein U5L45_18460 [Saprospiraceae bacterium]|nr:hypothetical protein [Saprospiraceae bacterium]